jgi:moderate conductance mechanosensitive channel
MLDGAVLRPVVHLVIAVTGEPDGRFRTGEWWAWFGIRFGIAVAVGLLVSLIARRSSRLARRKAKGAGDGADGRALRRRSTVVSLVAATAVVIVWFIILLYTLLWLGLDVGPLIASAGILGVALGFGAQTLVRDTISGLFILLEGQFDVGDAVDLQTEAGLVTGTIEGLTLRITSVRQFDGTLSIVPNGSIQVTSNKTRGWGRAIVDVRVAIGEDPERLRTVLMELFDRLVHQEPFATGLRKEPQILGVTQTTDTAQVIRVVAETQPSQRFEIERLLRERILAAITEQGIRVPPVVMTQSREAGDSV